MKISLTNIDEFPSIETAGSITISNNNNKKLYIISLGYFNDLRIYSYNNVEIIADQKADNYVVLKLNRSTETP